MTTDEGPSLWSQARELGDNPEGEWTYSLLIQRAAAMRPNGLDFAYEHLGEWNEVVEAADFVQDLLETGEVQLEELYSFSIGLRVFEGAFYAPKGRLLPPAPGERPRGKHSVALVGRAGEDLLFRNWWGDEWGDGGFGYLSREYFESYVDSVLAARPAWNGLSLAHDAEVKRIAWHAGRPYTITIEDAARAWSTENPISGKQVELDGRSAYLCKRNLYTISLLPFEVVELRDDHDALLGRLHLIHRRGRSETRIDELWVPPAQRRSRFGSYLLQVAEELARSMGTQSLVAPLHEADGHPRVASRARAFAVSNGFTWEESTSIRPAVLALASRSLQ